MKEGNSASLLTHVKTSELEKTDDASFKISSLDEDISIEKMEHIKGIALILLMWHHLFGCDYISSWITPLKGLDIMFGLGSRLCLGIFLFCSGYGLYKSYLNKKTVKRNYILKRFIKILIPYWVVMLVTIAYLIFADSFNPHHFFSNLFAWNDEVLYVSFAWYIKLYILLMLIMPLVRFINLNLKKRIFYDIVVFVLLPFVLQYIFISIDYKTSFPAVVVSFLDPVDMLIYWFPLFAIGIIFAKYNIYIRIRKFYTRMPHQLIIALSLVIAVLTIFLRYAFNYPSLTDSIYSPVFTVCCLLIMDNIRFKSKYIIPYLGKKSVYFWLLSGIFFLNTSELLPAITWPKIPLVMLIWTLALLTPFVYLCDFVSGKLIGLLLNKHNT